MIEINLAKIRSFQDKDTIGRLNHHIAVNGLENFYTKSQLCIATGASQMAVSLMLAAASFAGAVKMGVAAYDVRDLSVPFFIGTDYPEFPTVNPNTDEVIESVEGIAVEHVWFFTDKARLQGVRFVCVIPDIKEFLIFDYLDKVSI